MGRKKKEAEKKEEDGDDTEVWEDPVLEAETKDEPTQLRLRDWRDVERLRELKELRQLVDEDDPALEEIFKVEPKPEPVKATEKPGKNAPAKPGKPAGRPATEKPAAQKSAKAAPKAPPKKAPKKAATPRPKAKSKARTRR